MAEGRLQFSSMRWMNFLRRVLHILGPKIYNPGINASACIMLRPWMSTTSPTTSSLLQTTWGSSSFFGTGRGVGGRGLFRRNACSWLDCPSRTRQCSTQLQNSTAPLSLCKWCMSTYRTSFLLRWHPCKCQWGHGHYRRQRNASAFGVAECWRHGLPPAQRGNTHSRCVLVHVTKQWSSNILFEATPFSWFLKACLNDGLWKAVRVFEKERLFWKKRMKRRNEKGEKLIWSW